MSSPSSGNINITADGGKMQINMPVEDGQRWHIGYCVYKWSDKDHKLIFVKPKSSGLNIGSVDFTKLVDDQVYEAINTYEVGCNNIRTVVVNGVAGRLATDTNEKHYLVW